MKQYEVIFTYSNKVVVKAKNKAEAIEKAEVKYWLTRSFRQSLRDVRESGTITKGEQELLEQLGLDPLTILKEHRDFLSKQNIMEEMDVYLNSMIEKYKDAPTNIANKIYNRTI